MLLDVAVRHDGLVFVQRHFNYPSQKRIAVPGSVRPMGTVWQAGDERNPHDQDDDHHDHIGPPSTTLSFILRSRVVPVLRVRSAATIRHTASMHQHGGATPAGGSGQAGVAGGRGWSGQSDNE